MKIQTLIESQVQIIDTIVNYLNIILKLLLDSNNALLNQTIYETIGQIIKFTDIVIDSFPNLLIGDKQYISHRRNLIYLFDNVLQSWSSFFVYPDEFVKHWNIFLYEWNESKNFLLTFDQDVHTFYLSLN